MKRSSSFLFISAILLLAGIIFAGCSDETQNVTEPVAQVSLEKVIITCFTGTDIPIQILDPGKVEIKGGKYIIKHKIFKAHFESSSELITGTLILNHNAHFDKVTGEGFAHGTFVITPDADNGGTWEGSYHGKTLKTGESEWKSNSQLVGTGKGTFQNMQMYYFNEIVFPGMPATTWTASGEGCIKENGVE